MIKLNEKNIGKFNQISIFSILIIFAITIGILSIYSRLSDFELIKDEVRQDFIENKKEDIKLRVLNINRLIVNENEKLIENIKITIKERVTNSYEIANKIYQEYHKTKTKKVITQMIKDVLRPIRYDNGTGYIFMVSLDGIELLSPIVPQLENTYVYNLQDKKGKLIIQDELKIFDKQKEGYIKDNWSKPNAKDSSMIYQKLTFVKSFEELNLYIGSGMYIDEAIKKSQESIKEIVFQLNKQNPKDYFIISELLNINGGDKFAKILVHPTEPTGKIIGDKKKDLYGKYYRQVYLKGLKENQETYLNYSFINPQTSKEMLKISYFVLNKDWNWIIGTGFYDDKIKNKMSIWEDNFNHVIKTNIYTYIILFAVFSIILFIILFFINKFTNDTITRYKSSVRKKELELKILNENLEAKVIQEVSKNKNVQEQLYKSEKMVSMGEMIGNIAHQWRQPLSVISATSTSIIVQKECNVLKDDELIALCKNINTNAQYLSKTIDDFRNFIKGDRIKTVFILEECINSFLQLVDGSIKNNNINVILTLEKNIKINGYQNELTQCLINIFNNAKDALLERNIPNKLIFISTSIKNENIVIIFKDNAEGIPLNILDKIFDPYFTTKHKSKGTGLGLNMSYNLIVDGMNGTIEANNVEYQDNNIKYTGAEFIITLPIKEFNIK